MLQSAYIESSFLVLLRLILFTSCRKFLLHGLYHDLQHLTSGSALDSLPSEPATLIRTTFNASDSSGLELSSLPAPSTNPAPKPSSRTALHTTIARTAFAACFSESCLMFCMLMLQGLDIFSPNSRLLHWRISLFLLLALILVLIPLSLSFILNIRTPPSLSLANDRTGTVSSHQKRICSLRLILYLSPVALYLLALSYIPLPAAVSSSADIMTTALSRLIVIGTTILGLLSGFGATSNIWLYLPFFRRSQVVPTEGDLASAELSLVQITHELRSRKAEMQRKEVPGPTGSSWISRVTASFRGDEYQREIEGLEALETHMARNLDILRAQRDYDRSSRTFTGRALHQGGRIFAFYCVIRILSTLVNLLLPTSTAGSRGNNSDLIVELLAYVISLSNPLNVSSQTVERMARTISLGFVGIIILSSIRLVLRGVTKALRITSKNLGASLTLLLLAQLMGIYLLSTVVQLRTSFPPLPESTGKVVNLFSTIPAYEVFGSLFNWSSTIAAAGTAFIRWSVAKVTD